jgi:hypothetical protein
MHWFIFLQAPIQVVSFRKSEIDEDFAKRLYKNLFANFCMHTSNQYFNLLNFWQT